MTTPSEPQALPDLLAGFRLISLMRDEGVLTAADFALRVAAMRAKAFRLGIGKELREGMAEIVQGAKCAS